MNSSSNIFADQQRLSLCEIGKEFHARGWSRGTSSNYSVVLSRNPFQLLITASGMDKSSLTPDDFVIVDSAGNVAEGGEKRSSAETLLHSLIATEIPSVGAILHTHSVWGTILSGESLLRGSLRLEGYEMLKGLAGISTHESCEEVPVFENSQNMNDLSAHIQKYFSAADWSNPTRHPFHGFLLSRHGLYTWGHNLAEARRHIEIFEFLFEVVGQSNGPLLSHRMT